MNIKNTSILALIIIASTAVGVVVGVKFSAPKDFSQNDRIKQYYASETATLVSPHSIRKKMHEGKTDFVIVDVRSREEYLEEHVVGAVSIPAYIDRENSAQTDTDRVIEDFRRLQAENIGKDIIIYCYSSSCMTGRKIGHALANSGIYVKEMTIGWNEWKHFWKQWNYPHEWDNIDPDLM